MSDLICRKSMTRCQTPGMCSPHGGCPELQTVSAAWLEQLRGEFLVAVNERDQLNTQLGRQAITTAALKAERDQLNSVNIDLAATLDAAKGEIERLKGERAQMLKLPTQWSEVYEQVADLEAAHEEVDQLKAECEGLRVDAELAAKKLRSAEICHPRAVETLVDEAREALAKYLPEGWPESAMGKGE